MRWIPIRRRSAIKYLPLIIVWWLVLSGHFVIAHCDDQRTSNPADASQSSTSTSSESSAEEAAAVYQRRIARLRREQRQALENASSMMLAELQSQQDQWIRSGRETKASLAAWRSVALTWQTASDLPTAITLALQLRSQLSAEHQKRMLELVDQFSEQLNVYRQTKRDYQRLFAARMQRNWQNWSMLQKRSQLQDYYFLEDQRPEWLNVHRPVMASLPLDKPVSERLRSFESKRDAFQTRAEIVLGKQVQTLLVPLRQLVAQNGFDERQVLPVRELIHLLESDYGHGLRGIMLCEIDSDMPLAAQQATEKMLVEYRRLLADWRVQHAQLLSELKQGLETFRESLLEEQKFGELMAIDIAIAEHSDIVKPLRIFAMRHAASTAPEDCYLLDIGERGFHIEFLRDAQRSWLPRKSVFLKPTPLAPPYPLLRPPESSSPAKLFNLFESSGSLVCYTPGGWQACRVLDVSPFGLVVQFDDLLEPVYPLVARDCVR